MRASWLFLLSFLLYLLGPVRAEIGTAPPSELAPLAKAPFTRLVQTIYPTAPPLDRDLWSGRLAGATWAAAAVTVTYLALEHLAPPGAAFLVTACAALASPLWSGASRSDAPQAPAALVVALLLWLAVRSPHLSPAPRRLGDFVTGLLPVLLFLLDSTLVAAPLALVLFARTRPWTRTAASLTTAGAAAASVAALAGLPHLNLDGIGRPAAFDPGAFAASLVSPGHGLVFFVPWGVLAAAALVRGRTHRRLVRGGALVLVVVLAETACLNPFILPRGFGPAALAPYVPVLAVMAATLRGAAIRWGGLVALPAAAAHAGAVFLGGHMWEERRELPANTAALWDLRDSPFSDLLVGPPKPEVSGLDPGPFLMAPGEHATRVGAPAPWLLYGWEPPEATGRWASGRESWVVVAVPPGHYSLTLTATAPRVRGRPQRLEIEGPGGAPFEVAFGEGLWNIQALSVPFHPRAGVAVFRIRPAHTWQPGHGDVRRLTFFVASVRLERVRP